jgi:hypothetical protein
MTEEEIAKYRSILKQAAAFQEEKGLKVLAPPDNNPSKPVMKFVIRFAKRPNYPRSNRRIPKE